MDRLFIRLVVTIYLLVFAVTIVAAVLVSRAYAGPVAGDPCARGPCPITGAAVGIKVPLPGQGGHPTVTVKPLVTPKRLKLTIPPPGQFVGKFELVPLEQRCIKKRPAGETFVAKCPAIKNGHQLYAERNTYLFRTLAGDYVTVFAGMFTDLASTPTITWSVLPPDGAGAKEFPVHDSCYEGAGTFDQLDSRGRHMPGVIGRTRKAPYTRAECDEILREAMVALQVPSWKRIAIWSGVRVGGNAGWQH